MIETESTIQAASLATRHDLPALLEQIWLTHFSDTPRVNQVTIDYCYPWKSRLSLMRFSLDQNVTFIGINTLLQSPRIPAYVLLVTIAHELSLYSQGFGSPLPKNCLYPPARTLEQRNLAEQVHLCNLWIDKYWHSFYDKQRAASWINFSSHNDSPRFL